MPEKKHSLGNFEEYVLRALIRLRDNAYGVTIRQELEKAMDDFVSVGAVYTTLDRMEQKGYITSSEGEATPERGGRAKKYFKITGSGVEALRETERIRVALQVASGVEPVGVKL